MLFCSQSRHSSFWFRFFLVADQANVIKLSISQAEFLLGQKKIYVCLRWHKGKKTGSVGRETFFFFWAFRHWVAECRRARPKHCDRTVATAIALFLSRQERGKRDFGIQTKVRDSISFQQKQTELKYLDKFGRYKFFSEPTSYPCQTGDHGETPFFLTYLALYLSVSCINFHKTGSK